MLTDAQKIELEKEIQGMVDARVEKQVEERLSKEIIKRFSPGEVKVTLDAGDQPFKSLGEQLMAVKTAEISKGRVMDARLASKAVVGISEGIPADGGFLVQTDFATTLLEKTFAASDILNRVFRIPISANSNSIKIPAVSDASRADGSRFGGIRAYWMNEGGTKTPSYPSFAQVALELKKLIGYTTCTDELLEDAPALESWIMRAFASEFDFKLADAIINGDGAGKPLGILSAPCLVTVTAESGQGSSTIVAENIIKMWARMYSRGKNKAVWLANDDTFPQLATMALAVGTGGVPLWMPAGGLSGLPYQTLMGKPLLFTEKCQTLGTAGDIALIDFSQYKIGEKSGLQVATSIHFKFDYDQQSFRFVLRYDGQPTWTSALTPLRSSSTLSPFIVLATNRT